MSRDNPTNVGNNNGSWDLTGGELWCRIGGMMKTKPTDNSVKIRTSTYLKIKKLAKQQHRTIQGQIDYLLEWYTFGTKGER